MEYVFKEGAVIRCIDAANTDRLKHGALYTVLAVSKAAVTEMPTVTIVDESNKRGDWYAERFVLAQITTPAGEADPTGRDPHAPGAKLDAGKLRPTLVIRDMARALEAVIKVATDGANKYTPGGWLEVPNAKERYEDADLRHMLKRFKGEAVDTDSKSLHLAHNAWNALAKLELHLREQEKANT